LYLGEEAKPGCRCVEMKLFSVAADDGRVEVLKWGQDSGYELHNLLDKDTIAHAALNECTSCCYLRTLGIEWDEDECEFCCREWPP